MLSADILTFVPTDSHLPHLKMAPILNLHVILWLTGTHVEIGCLFYSKLDSPHRIDTFNDNCAIAPIVNLSFHSLFEPA